MREVARQLQLAESIRHQNEEDEEGDSTNQRTHLITYAVLYALGHRL